MFSRKKNKNLPFSHTEGKPLEIFPVEIKCIYFSIIETKTIL